MLEEVASKPEFEDTEDMVQRRSMSQEGINDIWKECCEKMEEEVLEKYKVEESKQSAYKGRGEPLE